MTSGSPGQAGFARGGAGEQRPIEEPGPRIVPPKPLATSTLPLVLGSAMRFEQSPVRLHPGEERGVSLLFDPKRVPPGTPIVSGKIRALVVLVVRHHASGLVREIARKEEHSHVEAEFEHETGVVTVYEGRREFKALERAACNAGFARSRVREYVPYRMLEVEVAATPSTGGRPNGSSNGDSQASAQSLHNFGWPDYADGFALDRPDRAGAPPTPNRGYDRPGVYATEWKGPRPLPPAAHLALADASFDGVLSVPPATAVT